MSEDVGRALKTIVNRLNELHRTESQENTIVKNNCVNCKYRHGVEYYDQQWGRFFCGQNWCDKDRGLMDTGMYNRKKGKGHEFISDCEYFEADNHTYDKIKNKEGYPH